jgi:hypothetical protein
MPGRLDIGFAVHKTLPAAIWAQVKRTVRTWRYARSIGADPTHWWGVYEGGTEICLASVGPLPGAEQRARKIEKALGA